MTNNKTSTASSRRTIAVAVVDDNRLVRDTLATLLGQIEDFHVDAAAVADDAFIEAAKPDVLLLDAGLADEDSFNVAAALNERFPSTKIIMMDLVPDHEDIVQFVNAGVSGFILKDATLDAFVATIRSVFAGDKVLPPSMTESLFSQIVKSARTQSPLVMDDVRLTPREQEVVRLIGEGLSNKEIALRLNIAPHTVKSHVRNAMEKLALHTRLQIAAFVRRDENA